jgi:hypothetical protein
MVAFGIVIALSILAGFFWGAILQVLYGSCYGSAHAELKSLGSEISGTVRGPNNELLFKLDFGQCIGGVVFVNGRENPHFKKEIREDCSYNERDVSFILGIPLDADRDVICRGMKHQFSLSGIGSVPTEYPEVNNDGRTPFCLLVTGIETSGGDYTYQINQRGCTVEEMQETSG